MVDIRVEYHGSLWLVRPLTKAATAWLQENVAGDAQYFGNALAVEPRYIDDLVEGISGSGLEVA
jgi:hypothetical protein